MSMPEFPEVNPELTQEQALNMILSSIAMEELALSHIINAEGEKLQYVLGTLETSPDKKPSVNEVLAVNQSISSLLDSVSQNQMILKSKMEKALSALPHPPHPPYPPYPPHPPHPPCPPHPPEPQEPPKAICLYCSKCSAVFKCAGKYGLWHAGFGLCWNKAHICGGCISLDPCDCTKIYLRSGKRFLINFAVNVKAKTSCECDTAISLRMHNHQCKDIYTVRGIVTNDKPLTVSMCGTIVETDCCAAPALSLKLVTPDSLIVEDSMLNIMEL